jgi:hypothetical protein
VNKFLIGNTETSDSNILLTGGSSGTVIQGNTIEFGNGGITFWGTTTNTEIASNTIRNHSDNCVYVNPDFSSATFHHNLVYNCDHLMRHENYHRTRVWYIYANRFYQTWWADDGLGVGKHIFLTGTVTNDSELYIYHNSFAGWGWAVDVGGSPDLSGVHILNNVQSVRGWSSSGGTFGEFTSNEVSPVFRGNPMSSFWLPSNDPGVNGALDLTPRGWPGMTSLYYVDGDPDMGANQGVEGQPPLILNPPTNLQVVSFNAVVPRSATLAWQYLDGSDPAFGFRLYHQPGCSGAFSLVGSTLPLTPLSTTHDALTVTTTYCWYLTAINEGGTESLPSATASYTPTPEEPPVIPPGGGGGSVAGMPVPGGPGLPLVLTTQPVTRDHPLFFGARAYWRVVPWLTGGSIWYDLLERVPLVATNMVGNPWGTTTQFGRDGEIVLPGGTAHFSSGTAYTDNGPFTVMLRARLNPQGGHADLVGQVNAGFTSGWALWRAGSDGQVRCSKNGDGSGTSATGPTPLAEDVWVTLGCTWDSTTLTLYVNGEPVASLVDSAPYSAGLPLQLGALPSYTTSGWGGSVDDVFFYTRGLSDTEMKRLHTIMQDGDRALLQTWSSYVQYGSPSRRLVRGGSFFQR